MITRLRRYSAFGIRLQLMAWYTIIFAILLVITGVVFYQYLETSLEATVDEALQLRAQQIAGDSIIKNGVVTIQQESGNLPGFGTTAQAVPSQPVDVNYGMLVRLLDTRERLLGETLAFRALAVPTQSVTYPLQGKPWQGTLLDATGHEVRLYSRVLTMQGQIVAVIQVGQSLAQLHALLHDLVVALLLVGSIVLLVCAALSYWLAARAFAPIHHLAQTARRIKAGNLHQRVPVPSVQDEVHYLAITLNEMIESLDQAFARQRRFVADASHELRTPVAVIRNKAGIALLDTPTLYETVTTLQDIRIETERLSHLISDLLALARGDEGYVAFEREEIRLDQMIEVVAANAETLAAECNVHLEVLASLPVTLMGDEARLIQVVMNLLDNAIRSTNSEGSVQIQVEATATHARLIVRDTGIGIAPEHLPHIFERFYRADPARKQTGGSSTGLGLAIVDWVVRLHGGTIAVASEVGHGTSFTVTLPLGPIT